MQQVVSTDIVSKAIANILENQSCADFHAGLSCNKKAFQQFVSGCKSVSKMYLMVHLIPFILFKRKKLRRSPTKQIFKLVIAFIKSLLFASGYTALVRRIVCLFANNNKFVGYSNGIAAIFSSATLCFEPVSRQSQIALFCLNKSVEVCYQMGLRRGWPIRVPMGECLLVAVSLSVITYHYLNNKQAIRQTYQGLLNRLLQNC